MVSKVNRSAGLLNTTGLKMGFYTFPEKSLTTSTPVVDLWMAVVDALEAYFYKSARYSRSLFLQKCAIPLSKDGANFF